MASVVVTPTAREDLRWLTRSHSLPSSTSERVRRAIEPLRDFPELGAPLYGRWAPLRFVLGPWRWMIIVHSYDAAADRVAIVTIQVWPQRGCCQDTALISGSVPSSVTGQVAGGHGRSAARGTPPAVHRRPFVRHCPHGSASRPGATPWRGCQRPGSSVLAERRPRSVPHYDLGRTGAVARHRAADR